MPKLTSKFVYSLVALLGIASASVALAQDAPRDVHAKLSLAGAKTTFRIGEPILVILEFTADRDGYAADVTPDKSETRIDNVSVSPDSGVYHWRKGCFGGGYRDYFSTATLSASPARIQFELNDSIRFDKPGRYSVRFTTGRVRSTSPVDYQPAIPLTTNDVSFDVEPMSADDEQKEIKRLSDSIDAAHDWQTQDKFARELSFLTGDASAREKVRRFFSASGVIPGNYFGEIYSGLFIARNRALVLQLLEAATRDPNTPVTSSLLGAITHLRLLQQNAGIIRPPEVGAFLDPNGDPRSREIQDAYVTELAAGLAKRTGMSQATTAITILSHLPKDPQAAGASLGEARRIVLQQFDNLTPFDHEYLLEQYWEQLRDPSLIPSLKKMLTGTDRWAIAIHKSVLKRLIELAPDEARPYVIAEISSPQSLVDSTILGGLPDQTIPEVDSILLNQLRALVKVGGVRVDIFIKQKAALAVRFATSGIYPDLMLLYRENAARLAISSRADLLAYLVKQNEREALPLIEEELDSVPPEQEFNFLPELTRLYFSDAIDAVLKKRLESDDPRVVSTAAYLISLHGPASDEKVIEARLERWLQDWRNRSAEADGNLQGTAERELVQALIRAKSWKASPERLRQLKQGCVTQLCRQNFPAQ